MSFFSWHLCYKLLHSYELAVGGTGKLKVLLFNIYLPDFGVSFNGFNGHIIRNFVLKGAASQIRFKGHRLGILIGNYLVRVEGQ